MSLVTNDGFLPGALCLGQTLRHVGSKQDYVIALGPEVSAPAEALVRRFGFREHRLTEQFDRPWSEGQEAHRWRSTLLKLSLLGLTDYSRVVFLDAGTAVVNNTGHLFDRPHLSAVRTRAPERRAGGSWHGFNSGVLVLEPNTQDTERCFSQVRPTAERCRVEEKPFSDQDVFDDVFPDWHQRIRLHLLDGYNVFWGSIDDYVIRRGFGLGDAFPRNDACA